MPDRVSAWLESLGLGIYREAFEKHAITWEVLFELNQNDLESLGVLLGHRKQELRGLKQSNQEYSRFIDKIINPKQTPSKPYFTPGVPPVPAAIPAHPGCRNVNVNGEWFQVC